MLRLLTAITLITTTATGIAAVRADPGGQPGTVTAYDLDGHTVIDTKACFRTLRHGGYDYARCTARLREAVTRELCRTKGPGTHGYLSQIGDGRPMRLTVYCRRR